MCTHQRYIYNKYTHSPVLVSCGKCKACRQQKAVARANRIRLNYSKDYIPIFCTFTYDNDSIPYVLKSDLLHQDGEAKKVPVYRNCRIFGSKRIPTDPRLIDVIECNPFDSLDGLRGCKKMSNCVSVCYYPDIQSFFKRYRQNLIRHYGIKNPKISYFACSEYGGHSQRAHFHALIFVPVAQCMSYKSAISESWPYGSRYSDLKANSRCYEFVRRDAASYISSYVNSNSALSPLLESKSIRQKHSYSHGFGASPDVFSLPALLSKSDACNLVYTKQVFVNDKSQFIDFPIPKYIINRYWPKFKGFGLLSASEIFDYVLRPARLYKSRLYYELDYNYDEYRKVVVSINNAYERFNALTGLNRFDFAHYYSVIWSQHKLTSLRLSYVDVVSSLQWPDFYFNNRDYQFGLVRSLSLDDLGYPLSAYDRDYNHLTDIVCKTINLELLYDRMTKQRKVTNLAMSRQGINV